MTAMTDLTQAIFRSSPTPMPVLLPVTETADLRAGRFVKTAGIFSLLAAVAWVAHFSQFRTFGVYSDDHTFAVQPLNWTWEKARQVFHDNLISFPEPQGRPLGFILGYGMAFLGWRVAGMTGMFVIAWLILSLNAILVERLARRAFASAGAAGPIPVLAGIFFLLFPADTNRPFLCSGHILQPSLTFMLLGAHLYLSGKIWQKALCYLLVAGCLLTYENAMLPIVVVPLLERVWDRVWFKRSIWHLVWVMVVVVTDSVARTALGEYRVMQANHSPIITVLEIITGSVIGPATVLHSFEVRAVKGFADLFRRQQYALVVIPAATGLFLLTTGACSRWGRWRWLSDDPGVDAGPARPIGAVVTAIVEPDAGAINYRSAEIPVARPAPRARRFVSSDLGRLAWFGTAAVFISYLFCFTHYPPFMEEGQSTSTHLAAAVGGGILGASGIGALLSIRPVKKGWFPAVLVLTSLYSASLLQSAVDEQDSYGRLWQQRQQFWTRAIDLCPDITEGTVIICDGFVAQSGWQMPVSSWGDSLVLMQSYEFPADWKRIPELQPFSTDNTFGPWTASVVRDAKGRAIWNPVKLPYGYDQKILHDPDAIFVPEGNLILLHVDKDNRVTRQAGVIDLAGKPFRLKDRTGPARMPFPTKPFHDVLLGTP